MANNDSKYNDWAWANLGSFVDHMTALTLLGLARRADSQGSGDVQVAYSALAREVVVNTRTVMRATQQLEDIGLLTVKRRWDPETGANLPNLFTLHSDRVIDRIARPISNS